jgi:hypothetical protein
MRLFWIKQLVCLMKKKSYTIVYMKLILAKLITCGLPWSRPNFSIDNECHLQISFDVGEIHLYTLSLLWMIRVHIYDWSHWRHCLSVDQLLISCRFAVCARFFFLSFFLSGNLFPSTTGQSSYRTAIQWTILHIVKHKKTPYIIKPLCNTLCIIACSK